MRIKMPESEAFIHLDFVPMVDVLFNLLIFFLLATTIKQAEREMQIALPYASASGPISVAMREIIINVNQEGRIFVNGALATEEELQSLVTNAVQENPDQKVSVRGDRRAAYGHIATVLDICKAAGVQEPYLDTILEE